MYSEAIPTLSFMLILILDIYRFLHFHFHFVKTKGPFLIDLFSGCVMTLSTLPKNEKKKINEKEVIKKNLLKERKRREWLVKKIYILRFTILFHYYYG